MVSILLQYTKYILYFKRYFNIFFMFYHVKVFSLLLIYLSQIDIIWNNERSMLFSYSSKNVTISKRPCTRKRRAKYRACKEFIFWKLFRTRCWSKSLRWSMLLIFFLIIFVIWRKCENMRIVETNGRLRVCATILFFKNY